MVLRAHDAIKAQSGKSCCRLGFGQRSRVWKKFTCGSFEMASKMSREHFSIREFLFRATVMWPGTAPRLRVAPQLPRRRPCFLLKPSNPRGDNFVTDEHQVNSIIAAAICEAQKDHPIHQMDPEQAKQIAKCITEALTGAGLQIVPLSND